MYVRDYFYAEDGALANMLLAEKLSHNSDLRGHAFNFSNEIQVNVIDVVQRILALMGSDLQPEIRGEATHEIRHQYLSASKAKSLLQWEPRFTLDEGLRKTIAWYREFLAIP